WSTGFSRNVGVAGRIEPPAIPPKGGTPTKVHLGAYVRFRASTGRCLVSLWNYLFGVSETTAQTPAGPRQDHVTTDERALAGRQYRFETLEPREMLSADPLYLGATYAEEDPGSDDNGGDTFEISFTGGADGTQLNRVVIDMDHDGLPTIGTNDLIFDTVK